MIGKPRVKGIRENIFQEIGTLFETFVRGVGFGFFCGDDGADIFEEIDAALFAFAAGAL